MASNVRHCLNLRLIFVSLFIALAGFEADVTFWEHFLRLLPRRPKSAFAALYWHLTRRRVRARNKLRVASAGLPFAYNVWISSNESRLHSQRACSINLAAPRFSVLLHASGNYSADQLARSMNSVERQNYRHWIVIGVTDDSLKLRIASADCDYMVPLRVGDELSIDALLHFAEAIQENREAAVLYGDEDRLDARGRRTIPWFKPRWNEEMFFAIDYLSSAVAIESSLARRLGANDSLIDIPAVVLAATATAEGPIVHVPHILTHVDARRTADTGRSDAVARLLEPLGATCASGPFGTIKVEWPLPPELPLITIVIPTRDKLELLRPCVESVLGRTNYDNFEILIIDNCSVEKPTAEYLSELQKHPRVRIASYPGTYNFSAINNFAVREAQGSYICLLNNDTQVIEPEWLTEMMRYAVRPKVGAVGAKLLYGDGSIQHAGVVIGIGEAAGHAHRLLPSGEPGYFLMPHVAHFVSAVTAACLLVERKKFDAVGGLDPELAVAFNDVDLCLKIEAAGWRNVYVPHAILIHHESKSRGKDMSPANIDRYRRELKLLQDRWNTKSYEDPLHNPNLDASCETYVLRL